MACPYPGLLWLIVEDYPWFSFEREISPFCSQWWLALSFNENGQSFVGFSVYDVGSSEAVIYLWHR